MIEEFKFRYGEHKYITQILKSMGIDQYNKIDEATGKKKYVITPGLLAVLGAYNRRR